MNKKEYNREEDVQDENRSPNNNHFDQRRYSEKNLKIPPQH